MNKLKTGLLAVVILGLAGTLLVQSNNISQLRTELVDKNQQAQESQKLLKELADLRTRLEDAEKIAFASSLELAGLRSKATQSRRMKEENRKLAARQQELLAERQELIERSRKAAEPEKEEINWQDKNFGPGASDLNGAARDWSSALRRFASRNNGQFSHTFEEAATVLNPGDPAKLEQTMMLAARFEIVFRGNMADLNSLPRESTILIREKHPWRNSKGVWTKSYGMADGTGQLITRPAGDFDKYEAVRIPEVSLHHPVFDEDLP